MDSSALPPDEQEMNEDVDMTEVMSGSNIDDIGLAINGGEINSEMGSVEEFDPAEGLSRQRDLVRASQDEEIDLNVTMRELQLEESTTVDMHGMASLEASLAEVQRQYQVLQLEYDSLARRANEQQFTQEEALVEAQRQYEALRTAYQSMVQSSEQSIASLQEALAQETSRYQQLQDEKNDLEDSFRRLAERSQERQETSARQLDTYQRELVVLREMTKPSHVLRDLGDQPKRHYDFPPGAQLAALYSSDCQRLNIFIDNLTVEDLQPEFLGDDAIIPSYVPQLMAAVWQRAEERVQAFLTERATALENEFGATNLACHFDADQLTRPPIDGATNVALRFFVTYLQSRGVDQLMQTVQEEISIAPSSSDALDVFDNDLQAWVVAKVLQSPQALWLHKIIHKLCVNGGDGGCLSTMEAPESVLSLYVTFVRWLILCRSSDPVVKLSPPIGTEMSRVTSLVDVNELVTSKSMTLINHIKFRGKDLRATPAKAFVLLPPMLFTTRTQTKVQGLIEHDGEVTANEVRPRYGYVVEGDDAIDELNRFVTSYVPAKLARLDALIRGEWLGSEAAPTATPATEAGAISNVDGVPDDVTQQMLPPAPPSTTATTEAGCAAGGVLKAAVEDKLRGHVGIEPSASASADSAPVTDHPVAHDPTTIEPPHHSRHLIAEQLATLEQHRVALHVEGTGALVVRPPADDDDATKATAATATATAAPKRSKHRNGTSSKPPAHSHDDNDSVRAAHEAPRSSSALNGPFHTHSTAHSAAHSYIDTAHAPRAAPAAPHNDDHAAHRRRAHETHEPQGRRRDAHHSLNDGREEYVNNSATRHHTRPYSDSIASSDDL